MRKYNSTKTKKALTKQCPNCGHPRPKANSTAAWQVEGYIKALEKNLRRSRKALKEITDAYTNMRDFAESKGIDVTCYGPDGA